MSTISRRPPAGGAALAAIGAAALALRLLAWRRATLMTNDGPDFLWQAGRLLDGHWEQALAHHYHPLYALLTAGVAPLAGGDLVAAALAVSLASGLALVLVAHALGRQAFPERPGVALAAAALAAIHASSVAHTADVRADGLHAALFAGGAAALVAASRRGGWRWPAAGAAIALAYLTRPEGLFLLAPALLALWVRATERGWRAAGRGALGLLAALLLLAGPYLLALREADGTWRLSGKPSLAAVGLGGAGPPDRLPADCPLASPSVARARPAEAAPGPAAAPAVAADAPLAGARDVLAALAGLGGILRVDVLLLAALGWPALWRTRRGLALALLASLGGWLALMALHHQRSGYLADRYLLAPAQLLLPPAAAGWLALWHAPRLRPLARLLALLVVVALLLGAAKSRHADQAARLEALAFAAAHSPPGERLVVHRRKDGWYAGRPVLLLPLPCDEDDLLARLRRREAGLLVLDEDRVRRAAPGWLEDGRFETLARFGAGEETVVVLRYRG